MLVCGWNFGNELDLWERIYKYTHDYDEGLRIDMHEIVSCENHVFTMTSPGRCERKQLGCKMTGSRNDQITVLCTQTEILFSISGLRPSSAPSGLLFGAHRAAGIS